MLLQNAGLSHIRSKALTEYIDLTRSAFREFVSIRILQRLDLPTKGLEGDKAAIVPEAVAPETPLKADDGIVTTETELEVFHYVKRRLSFLVKDDALFDEIANIEYRDYKGKFVVFYRKERAGRIFDFTEGGPKKYNFDFGQFTGGEISTDKLTEIDTALSAVFSKRVTDLNMPLKKLAKVGGVLASTA